MSSAVYMDEVLRPNRSLSARGFIILIAILTVLDCITAGIFLVLGAPFVPFFIGLDLLAVIVAFMVSFASARRTERIQVTATEVRVIREFKQHAETVWISPTAETRVRHDDEEEEVTLRRFDRILPVAQALTPKRRAEFAKALDLAIWRARRSGGF